MVTAHSPLVAVEDVAAGCLVSSLDSNLYEFSRTSPAATRAACLALTPFFFAVTGRRFDPHSLCVVADWELDQDNLAEAQYRCLAHDSIRGAADPKIKPNLQEKERLDQLAQMAGDHLHEDDKDLLYK